MCLAIPVKIIEIKGDKAVVDADGVRREASLMLMEKVSAGDYVLLHAGFAIQKIDEEQALESIAVWNDMRSIGENK